MDSLDTTKLSRVKQVLDAAEKHNHDNIDMDISFEYLIGSCFPSIYQNVLDALKEEHTKGYIEGLAAGKDLTLDEIYDKIKEKL